MDRNNQIDWNDTDRIVSNDTRYVSLDGDWWRESSTWQTRRNGSSELTLMGRSRIRLTGLGKNGEAASSLLVQPGISNLQPQYDADGNQTLVTTKTGRWRVTYNGENRPVRWELVSPDSNTPNSNTQTLLLMSYDHMGRRRTKNNQRFIYNGYLQIANHNSSTSYFNYYLWDPTEPVATRPLVWQRGNFAAYYVFDGNKNVSEVVAADNGVAAHYDYAPFGALIICRDGTSQPSNLPPPPTRFSESLALLQRVLG